MRVALYARVSSSRQVQTQTIEQQLERLQNTANERGHHVDADHIFRDDGLSGARLNRPGLDRLRDRVTQHDVDLVLITAPDRLARKYVHQMLLLEEFEKRGCTVEFIERPMSQDPHDQLLLQIRGAVSEYERSLIADRMRRGRLAKLKAGVLLPWTQPPFGYRVDPACPRDPAGVRLEPAEAELVQQLYDWYLEEGATFLAIIARLKHANIQSPKGKALWVPSTVRQVLCNPVYTGTTYGNRWEAIPARSRKSPFKPVGKSGQSHRQRPREEWVPIAVPAIVEQEVFDRVQSKLSLNQQRSRRNNTKHPYLLRGLVSCGRCRCSCPGRTTKSGQSYYACSLKTNYLRAAGNGVEICTARYTPAQQLDEIVWADLCAVLKQPDLIELALERRHGGAWLPQELQARQANLRAALSGLEGQRQRLLEAYLARVIELGEFERARMELDRKREQIEIQQRLVQVQVAQRQELAQLTDSLEGFCASVREGLEHADFDRKRLLVELLVDRVIVEEEHVEIRYAVPTSRDRPRVPFCQLRFDYFNRIGCVHHLPDLRRKRKERRDPGPVALPRCPNRRVFGIVLLSERDEGALGLLNGRGGIDRLRSAATALCSFQFTKASESRTMDHVDGAKLHLRLGEDGFDRLGKALQPVHASDEHIPHAPVLELGQHREPELGSLGFEGPQAQHLFGSFEVHADGRVDRSGSDQPVFADFDVQAVEVKTRIDRL
ncbi:site-specific recombinase, DNA invertase Pin (plasmid) [Deinococcus peraridilitoris DSM 19664]|uniref:Site-specific recombinase, DNA invertase Pin n=2 Tax=Deinococcus peraridilitoris (strain DSM 19664 / LMG 22246 / CIP 109416 / KR-200) TaxID=937777 RepID=L0A6H6_DEIPD|nr:site-specific recombinase, DNA invertase Pin [Deinococcus peraridilitoris DSM 19664]